MLYYLHKKNLQNSDKQMDIEDRGDTKWWWIWSDQISWQHFTMASVENKIKKEEKLPEIFFVWI